jgi:hypothetical protein
MTNLDDLRVGSKVRLIINEGEFQHETIFNVERRVDRFVLLSHIEQNNRVLQEDQQAAFPVKVNNPNNLVGYEIFRE